MRTLDVFRQPLLLTTLCGALGAACGEPLDEESMTAGPLVEPTAPDTTVPGSPTMEPSPSTTVPSSSTTGSPSPTTEPTPTMPVAVAPTTEPTPTMPVPAAPTAEPEPSATVPPAPTTEPEPSTPEPADTPGDVVAMTFAEVREFLDTDTGTIAPCFFCHSEGGDLPQVFRNDDTLYDTLVTRTISRCEDRALVVPGDPDSSALYLVLSGSCGTVSQMPYGCYEAEDGSENSCTSYEDRERLRLWIEAGAPQ